VPAAVPATGPELPAGSAADPADAPAGPNRRRRNRRGRDSGSTPSPES
jgi:hypothetical protein